MTSDLDRSGSADGHADSYTYRINRQIAQLQKCEQITEAEVQRLCLKAREILIEEGNVQHVDSPVTVRVKAPASESPLTVPDMW